MTDTINDTDVNTEQRGVLTTDQRFAIVPGHVARVHGRRSFFEVDDLQRGRDVRVILGRERLDLPGGAFLHAGLVRRWRR